MSYASGKDYPRVEDAQGNLIEEGTRVKADNANGKIDYGVVTAITDFDGDVDGEGREIGINPIVYVTWDGDTGEERFETTWDSHKSMDDDTPIMVCDDIDVDTQIGGNHA